MFAITRFWSALEPHKWVKFKEWENAEEARKIVNYAIKKVKKLNLA